MHASTEFLRVPPAREPIDVRRIRLTQPAGASAVVAEFRTADQVLARWIDREAGSGRKPADLRRYTFEITFVDGYTFHGCYEFGRSARRRPSLTHFVRGIFDAMAAPQAGLERAPIDLSRYAIDAN